MLQRRVLREGTATGTNTDAELSFVTHANAYFQSVYNNYNDFSAPDTHTPTSTHIICTRRVVAYTHT